MVINEAIKEVIGLKNKFDFEQESILLHCDNQNTIHLEKN